MRNRFIVFLFFICSCFFIFADSYNEVAGSGLYIESVPSGAKVFIDGAERGLTPYSIASIRSGEYNIRIEKEGYVDRRFIVVIRSGSRIEISVDLEEAKGQVFLEIRKDPEVSALLEFNPGITVDGMRLPSHDFSTTPVFEQNFSLPAGWRTITVEAFGWERVSTRILVEEGSIQKLEIVVNPAVFTLINATLRKKRFNPRDSGVLGTTDINFSVSAPGSGILEVLDLKGELVYSKALDSFSAWQQQASWNGRNNFGDIAGDGYYTIRISAWNDQEKQSIELSVLVDSSIAMRPLSIASSLAGLLYCPSPDMLPSFSYQIEGSLISGKPLFQGAWDSLPFAIGLRMSFLDNLEAAIALNAMPDFSDNFDWGVGASVKWVFFRPLNTTTGEKSFSDALGMAAEVSYGWATVGPYTAFGMGAGAGLHLPILLRVAQGIQTNNSGQYTFDLLLSPLVLWASEKGYPDSFLPRLGMEGGMLFSYGSIALGLSLRWDYDLKEKTSGPIVSALEFKYFPSSFILSVTGGFWYLPGNKETGLFFGAGMGIMH